MSFLRRRYRGPAVRHDSAVCLYSVHPCLDLFVVAYFSRNVTKKNKLKKEKKNSNCSCSEMKHKWFSSQSIVELPLTVHLFCLKKPSVLLAAAVCPSIFSSGDDDGRTTAKSGRLRNQAGGGEKEINRSSETKGHLLAWNDDVSSGHKGEDGDKSVFL